ncbi:DUF418 domain-containing protein [Sphingomonas solaris]|uniref:DUF418 domain-containing protein n=1 Tax=Alterirhizorhabdus solaris TaxID=2529389 RepID=A0A558R9V4_9SPHN|nr:DUF418 domain-containing protein [Sphingomonas solaris]TVV76138.1 DUF418 domain-containing protein [Sphingomonas solaris]
MLGILVMNIVAMGMPVYAYVDPFYYGGATGADLAAWALAYVFADGKMRALFTMLFGASLLLIADRAERPAWLHYRRMGVLLLFGMAHAWLLWFGDILVEYALVGAVAFIGWRWRPAALLSVAALCFAFALADDLLAWQQLAALRAAALAPGAMPGVVEAWQSVLAAATPQPSMIAREIALYRGGFAHVMAARAPTTLMFQTRLLALSFPETLGYVALGMALYRLGCFGGAWRLGVYRLLVGAGVAAAALEVPVSQMLVAARFDPATIPLADALSFVLRPWLALGYVAAIVLVVRAGRLRGAIARLAAAGRMALSNYIATSLVATTLFYGYGAGLYGRLDRAELYLVVAAIWAMMLLWSPAWLTRFAYGPLEWVWRATSRGVRPRFRSM